MQQVIKPGCLIGLLLCSMLALGQKTKVEKVPKCEGVSLKDRAIVAVSSFNVTASGAQSQTGGGLSTMLINALVESECFRVVERERLNEVMQEQSLGLSGAGDQNNFAQVGKLTGAQLLVMGTVTEFKDVESGGAVGAAPRIGAWGRRVLGGAAAKTAHLGYTIRLVNPSTGEVILSKSFDKKKTDVGGLLGGSVFGVPAGGLFFKSKAMQDAIEESLIEAVGIIGQYRTQLADVAKTTTGGSAVAVIKPGDCALVSSPKAPRIMVIIPEEHVAGVGSNYNPNRVDINISTNNNNNNNNNAGSGVSGGNNSSSPSTEQMVRSVVRMPDPAGETEVAKKFLEFGFTVIDKKQYEKNIERDKFINAFENPNLAAQIGARYGADIIIVGEAFSEYSKNQHGMISCRARVEAKAIETNSAKILATDGYHGSGLDIGEAIAGKTALKNAGSQIANYFLGQICDKYGGKSGTGSTATNAGNEGEVISSELQITNVDFNKFNTLVGLLQKNANVKNVEESMTGKTGTILIRHTNKLKDIVMSLINNNKGIKLEVNSYSNNKYDLVVK
jgi:curli biogenesis system outer membrane secretion channel CsgG